MRTAIRRKLQIFTVKIENSFTITYIRFSRQNTQFRSAKHVE